MDEVWKQAPGFAEFEVSTLGRVPAGASLVFPAIQNFTVKLFAADSVFSWWYV